MDKPMMKCGHAAMATDAEGNPVCVICVGIHDGAREVAEPPNLTGRKAKCTYGCKNSVKDSKTSLAFFEHLPQQEFDRYYCGCYGWD